MKLKHVPIKSRRGTVLLTALMTLLIIGVMGLALLSLSLQGLHATRRVQSGMLAFNLAESGSDRALRWLKDQPSPPPGTSSFDPFEGEQQMDGGTYSVLFVPDPMNQGSDLKRYKIVATGRAGTDEEIVELIVRQSSFGKYAYFTDSERSAVSGGRIWFFSGDRIRGPAHSNNSNGSEFQIQWGYSPGPIFEGHLTSSGSFINFSPRAPRTEPEFAEIFLAGSRGYELGVDYIPLPQSTDIQELAAWGAGGSLPTTNGVYTPVEGGIYIKGNSEIDMQVDGGGRQVFNITQGSTVTKLTIDHANDVMYKQVGSGPVITVPGSGNGMVYSTGHITSLSGTIADNKTWGSPPSVVERNSYTIATDVNAGMDITLTGPLKHLTPQNPSLPPNDPSNVYSGTVGLIGQNVYVGRYATPNMEIDAIIMAGNETTQGSFTVANYSRKRPVGTLKVLGGIIQKSRGAVGTLRRGRLYTGYKKDYYYDGRMADNPPPFFPTTGGYDKLSWSRLTD